MRLARITAVIVAVAVALAGCGGSHGAGHDSTGGHGPGTARPGNGTAETAPHGPHPDLGPFAGYVWHGDARSVHAAWTVPRLLPGSLIGEAATWIGVEAPGPSGRAPFVQAGINEGNTGGSSRPFYYAFYSTTRLHFHPVHLFDVRPGDEISATLRRTGARWQIILLDHSSGSRRQLSAAQAGSGFNEAQYTQEDVTDARTNQPFPYPTLSPVRFTEVSVDGATPGAPELDASWLTEADGYLAPGPIAHGSFLLSQRAMSGGDLRYLQAIATLQQTTDGATMTLVRWATGAPGDPTVPARGLQRILHETLADLRGIHWPADARADIAAVRATGRRLTVQLATVRAVAPDRRLAWSEQLASLVNGLDRSTQNARRALGLPSASALTPTR